MLTIRHLEKKYKENERVLKDISCDFEEGKIYVIKGVSGCGKTTLLNCIGGLDNQYKGEIHHDKPGVSYIFQQSLLISGLTALENIKLVYPNVSDEEINNWAKLFGVYEYLNRQPSQLSGGERQRIAVLRSIIGNPSLILADEPTASLDDATSRNIADLIAGLKKVDRIIIIVTHEDYFDDYADEILFLNYGQLEGKNTENDKAKEKCLGWLQDNDKANAKGKAWLEIKFFLKRNGNKLTPFGLLPVALIFLAIMLLSAIQKNLPSEMIKKYSLRFPMDTVEIRKNLISDFSAAELSEMDIYEYFRLDDNGVVAYGLLPEKYSAFMQEGMIEYGHFPEKENEVLVSPQAAVILGLPVEVGQTISFMGESFIVSGFTGDIENDEELVGYRRNEIYLRSDYRQNAIFIPYETISKMGDPSESVYAVYEVIWHGFSKSSEKQKRLETLNNGNTAFSAYYWNIEKVETKVKIYLYYLAGVAVVLMLGSSVFIVALIRAQLFARKRELGYLQVFGVTKKRLRRMLEREYLIRLAIALFYALSGYILVSLVGFVFTKSVYLPGIIYPVALISILAVLYMIMVFFSVSRYLKTDIVRLIH